MNRRFANWSRRFRQYDLGRKFIALLLAVILSFVVRVKNRDLQPPQIISGVNVELQLPPDVVCAQGTSIPVQLVVSGPDRQLARLSGERIRGILPVQCGVLDGPLAREVTLTPDIFQPKYFGMTIERIVPAKIELKLDKVEKRCLPIRQVFDSEERLPEGYMIRSSSLQPGEVTVSGPSAVISALRQVRTMPVPIDRYTREGFDFVANLQPLDGVKMQPDRVTVHVEIGREESQRRLNGLACSLLLSAAQRKTLSAEFAPGTPAADVVVRGPEEICNTLQESGIRIFADLAELRSPGTYMVPLTGLLLSPEARKLEIVRITPARVKVILHRLPAAK